MKSKHRARIVITVEELAKRLGLPGGRICQIGLDNECFDDCVIVKMEHDSLPEVYPGQVLQYISVEIIK